MSTAHLDIEQSVARMESRLAAIEGKLDSLGMSWRKSMEWIAQMGEHVQSLDEFREEVRASLEPLFVKLQSVDEVMRIMRHATSDVARRIEELETGQRRAG